MLSKKSRRNKERKKSQMWIKSGRRDRPNKLIGTYIIYIYVIMIMKKKEKEKDKKKRF